MNTTCYAYVLVNSKYLCINLQLAITSPSGVNSEFCRLVDDAASGLQAWAKGLHLEPRVSVAKDE